MAQTRVYIVSQTLGTVHIAENVPVESRLFGRPLGTLLEEGPSVDNHQPSRMMATCQLRPLREHPFNYTGEDCAFLGTADYGTWQKTWHETGMRWERIEDPQ